MSAPTAAEIVAEISAAKGRWFDPYLAGPLDRLKAEISGVIVPESDWREGYHAAPVRISVATPRGIDQGRFIAVAGFNLALRDPNMRVDAMVEDADGLIQTIPIMDVVGPARGLKAWEVAVMEARWAVQFAAREADRLLGIDAAQAVRRQPQLWPVMAAASR